MDQPTGEVLELPQVSLDDEMDDTPSSGAVLSRVLSQLNQAVRRIDSLEQEVQSLKASASPTVAPYSAFPIQRARTDNSDELVPTEEQLAVLQRAQAPVTRIIALAGTGKTATLAMVAKRRGQQTGLYFAFNKAIANEAQERFPGRVRCRTGHALAYRALGLNTKAKKVATRIFPDELIGVITWAGLPERMSRTAGAAMVIDALNTFFQSADREIARHHVLSDRGPMDWIVGAAREAWKVIGDIKDTRLPITHDGYFKLWQLRGGPARLKYDYILIDEAQDLNPVTIDVIAQMTGDKFAVGDPWQQIYSWRGATNALDQLEGIECYLSQSFRFGPVIADVANKILSFGLSVPQRPLQGTYSRRSEVTPHGGPVTAIVCRTNAGVLEAAAAHKVRLHIIGGFDEISSLAMSAWSLRAGQGKKATHPTIRRFRSWDVLQAYLEDCRDPELEMICKLIDRYGSSLFDVIEDIGSRHRPPDMAELTLSSAHKSKGLQWPIVQLHGDFPSLIETQMRLKREPSQALQEEIHLLYVASTRAQDILRLPKSLLDEVSLAEQN